MEANKIKAKASKKKKLITISIATIIILVLVGIVIVLSNTPKSDIDLTGTGDIRTTSQGDISTDGIKEHSNESMTKVLFIGNSYTDTNDMPNIVKELAESAGKEVMIESYTKGGYSLLKHISPGEEYSEQLEELLGYDWDVVILQDQSLMPIKNKNDFFEGAEKIASFTNRDTTRIILFSTWTRQTDELAQSDIGRNKEDLRIALKDGYLELAEKINAEVSPVGEAFNIVEENGENVNLYSSDGSHPSYEGSYLAACVHYAVIFGESCNGINYYGNTSSKDKDLLQECAMEAVNSILR